MKMTWIFAATACLLLAAHPSAYGEDLKVGVVNMELVMKAYPETQSSRLILEQQLEEFEGEQKEMVKELEKLSNEFRAARAQSLNTALSEEAREKNRLVAETKLETLKQRKGQIQETAGLRRKQLQDQQLRMRRRIVKKLRKMVAGYCEQNDIELVFDGALPDVAGPETVVYVAKRLDITEAILALIAKEDASGD